MKLVPFYLVASLLIAGCSRNEQSVQDTNGNIYPIQKFGDTYWMLENLRVTTDRNGHEINYWFADDEPANRNEYGLLYDYETSCKICPEGWVLPTVDDWNRLLFPDGDSTANRFKDPEYWGYMDHDWTWEFTVRPTGYGNNGEFDNFFNSKALFWTKSQDTLDAVTVIFEKGSDIIRMAPQHGTYAFSVRCIRR